MDAKCSTPVAPSNSLTGDGRCGREPLEGSSFCSGHQTTRAAAREKEEKSQKEIANVRPKLDVPEPKAGSYELSRILPRMLEALDRVSEWEQKAYRNLMKLPEEDWRFEDRAGVEQMRSEVVVYERALDRTTRVLRDIAKLDIDSRMAAIQKNQAEVIVSALVDALSRADVPENQARIVRDVFYEQLGSGSGGPESGS